MQQNIIFALHGFLGEGHDWFSCEKHLQTNWVKPSLFSQSSPTIEDFETYICHLVQSHSITKVTDFKKVFVGYSLGGRLGLHLLKNQSHLFDHFFFVSTNPGLADEKEKAKRLESDAQWAKLLENESWDSFFNQWNSQDVFNQPGLQPSRYEKDFDKKKLSSSFKNWSLGLQEDFRQLIKAHNQKITWVVGEKDSKFLTIAEDMKQKKILQDYSRINSGHRVLFENPKELSIVIQNSFRFC